MSAPARPDEPPDGPLPLRVTVDDREARSGLAAAVGALWPAVYVGRLAVGDVEIGSRVVVERKTVADLVASLEDGRLFQQARALTQTAASPLLVVEGEDALDAAVLTARSLRGVLLTLVTGFRLPVLRTGSVEETAVFVAHIAEQEARRAARWTGATGERPRAVPRPDRTALDVLGAIPGVADTRARRLLEQFGSVGAVLGAGPRELDEVPGVGPRTAAAVRRAAASGAGPAPPSPRSGRADR
jgi:DNA excision repair protein ERCC-4